MAKFSVVERAVHRLGRARPGALLGMLALLTGFTAAPAHAIVMLDYTGNNFTNVNLSGAIPPSDLYTTGDSVRGWITLPTKLGPDLVDHIINPVAFSFTDGVNTIDQTTATQFTSFLFSTDSGGAILQWLVQIHEDNVPGGGGGTSKRILSINRGINTDDNGWDKLCGPSSRPGRCATTTNPFYNQLGYVIGSPGVWAYKSTGVPEASTLTIALVGLGALGLLAWRRRVVPAPSQSQALAA